RGARGAGVEGGVFSPWPGARALHEELAVQRRPQRGAGRHDAGGRGLYRAQHALRLALPAGRSARARGAMTDPVAWRGWLLDPAPASRRQARLGRWYRAWMAFRRNGLAMTGLCVVLALVFMAMI